MAITGDERNNNLRGDNDQNTIDGKGGNDKLFGLGNNDSLLGGAGRDELSGGSGQDILKGEGGADELNGGGDNDTLYALGDEISTEIRFQNALNVSSSGVFPAPEIPAPDTLTGGEGSDQFFIQETGQASQGFGFYPGQQYALIKDFEGGENGEGDTIRLPGVNTNYRTIAYDSDGENGNDSTAIVYSQNPTVDISLSAPVIGISGGQSIQVNKEDSLVALVEGSSVGNLTDSDFYVFGSGTEP